MIAALALLRVHVLVVELPGRPLLRLRAEAAVRARQWVVTTEPVDADLVLVCGAADGELAAAVDAVWARVPPPRARRTVRTAEELRSALDSAARVLADTGLQRRAAADGRPDPAAPDPGRSGPLGPDWPPGLVIDHQIGPDGRISAVGLRRLAGDPEPLDRSAPLLAIADAVRLLRLAGWPAPALRLERVIDLALDGTPLDRLRPALRRVATRVRRSATFGWTAARDLPSPDLRARVLDLLDAASAGEPAPPPARRALIGRRTAELPLLVAVTEPSRG